MIGVFLPPALTESFEIVLSRCLDLYKEQKDFKIICCQGCKSGCIVNPFGFKSVCRHCKSVTQQAVSKIIPDASIIEINSSDKFLIPPEPVISNTSLASKPSHLSALSTILTFYRADPRVKKFSLQHWVVKKIYFQFIKYSEHIYLELVRAIKSEDLDKLEFFNGRIIPSLSACWAAKSLGISYGIIEVSGEHKRLSITSNSSLHSLTYRKQALESFVKNEANQRRQEGPDFFMRRRNGSTTDIKSYQSSRPSNYSIKSPKPIVSIFTSSIDEFLFLGDEWLTPASRDPAQFINKLSRYLQSHYHIIVRMHPNQKGDKTGRSREMYNQLKSNSSIQLYSPQNNVSSYQILDASYAVITFGSSIGIEATYWGKPSILIGRSAWEDTGVAYNANSVRDVLRLLNTNLHPCSKSTAATIGSYYLIGDGHLGSLSYKQAGKNSTFLVDSYSFLSHKRRSVFYWLYRLIDRIPRV